MAHSYCRRVIGAKHLKAAQLLVLEGQSGYRALVESGFSKWTARNFGRLLRECWALRAAIEMVQNETKAYLDPRKIRHRRRYQRKPVVENVRKYVHDTASRWTNEGPRYVYQQERRCRAVAEGKPPKAEKARRYSICPQCGVKTEEKNMRYTLDNYICSRCAGY